MNIMKRILIVFAIVTVLSACQEATQPSDLTATRTVSVEVRNDQREPVADADISWLKYTGKLAPMSGQGLTGKDGFSRFVIPNVATKRDSIRLTIKPPNREPYSGISAQSFDISICNDTAVSLSLSKQIGCGTTTIADTIIMEACPETGQVVATECRFYSSDCPPGLVFSASQTAFEDISLNIAPSGTTSSAVMVCANYSPSDIDRPIQVFETSLEGRDPASNTVQLRIALTVIGRVNCTPCPCPDFTDQSYTTKKICVGSEYEIVIPFDSISSPMPGGSDCVYEFILEQPVNDPSFEVAGSNSFMVRGGQTPLAQTIRVRGTQTGDIKRSLVYSVSTRRSSGGAAQSCESRYITNVTVPVQAGTCRVQPLIADTLKKCVFSDSSTTDTVYLVNDGDCEVAFSVDVDRPTFSLSQSGTVIVAAKDSIPIIIRFNASKFDWDNNPASPSGSRGEKPFMATLRIRGCDTADVPLNGSAWVICSAFKYQCLRQFRPPSYPDVYAESIQLVENKTDIIYQNDNQTFKVYDIYIENITLVGGTYSAILGSGKDRNGFNYGRFYSIATGFTINPGQSVCDTYPATAQSICNSMKADPQMGQNPSVALKEGDVVLFVKEAGQQCALIWIQSIAPDRPGPNSLPAVCIEICYPVFTL